MFLLGHPTYATLSLAIIIFIKLYLNGVCLNNSKFWNNKISTYTKTRYLATIRKINIKDKYLSNQEIEYICSLKIILNELQPYIRTVYN